MTKTLLDIAELSNSVGREFGPSEWVMIDQRRIDLFADATGDHQWIHTDPERAARESPFGKTIAHGHLTLSLAPWLLSQLLEVKGVEWMVNPGFDNVRMRAPVPVDSRVRMSVTLEKARVIRGGGVRVTYRFRYEIEGSNRAVALGSVNVVYYSAASAETQL